MYYIYSHALDRVGYKPDRNLFALYSLMGCLFMFAAGCAVIKKHSDFPKALVMFYNASHQGARGLMPEETIPAMKGGLLVGGHTLEFDWYVSEDNKVILHHDPSFNPDFQFLPDGSRIPVAQRNPYIFYKMNYAETGVTNPSSEAFVKILMDVLEPYLFRLKGCLIIQCFSVRLLQLLHQQYPGIALDYLTVRKTLSFEDNIKKLTFNPDFYLPYFALVTPALVKKCNDNNIKIVPWTVMM